MLVTACHQACSWLNSWTTCIIPVHLGNHSATNNNYIAEFKEQMCQCFDGKAYSKWLKIIQTFLPVRGPKRRLTEQRNCQLWPSISKYSTALVQNKILVTQVAQPLVINGLLPLVTTTQSAPIWIQYCIRLQLDCPNNSTVFSVEDLNICQV